MIYVMSDIHGQIDQFHEVLKQIRLEKTDKLYILGDVIDRNPNGIEVLAEIRSMTNAILMLGNHEYMMLQAIQNPEDEFLWRAWFANGGMKTYDCYMEMPIEEREELIDYLGRLPINIDITLGEKEYLLVHGIPIEMCKETRNSSNLTSLSVWSRIEPWDIMPTGKVVIFGHTPTENYSDVEPMSIWYGERMIGIDCGCAYGSRGRLACLRLDDMKEFYSSSVVGRV